MKTQVINDHDKIIVVYNGKSYPANQASKLGLYPQSGVKENRWTYKLTNVKAKRSKSGKTLKVSGKLVVTNIPLSVFTPAKKVKITTKNGIKYAKLTKKLTFKKTFKIKKKVKKVTLRAGYTGKTGLKAFTVLSANKSFKVTK
ncbi:hypothetical protein [Levilactobacillus suantsaiihabitans]|uniref:Uncharacterized protein n=1 Tax=Levilactobacillus suantsaiihabitans TaxID=2487722 RepID=A0A4Z0JCE6_9LACO|nr:hypothetical protein [Levilactobacillus suantsaiihabitans]TGD19543.1 hypothetical protein EGT51_03300 [Levilactobacillus suantsaiihabitans]